MLNIFFNYELCFLTLAWHQTDHFEVPHLSNENHSACRQAQCRCNNVSVQVQSFAFKNITVANPTWYGTWILRHEKWQMTWYLYSMKNIICFKKLLVLQKTLYNCKSFFYISQMYSSMLSAEAFFLQEASALKPSSLKWERTSKLSLTLTKRIQPPRHVMTIVDQHRPSILSFQIESDWWCQAVEGQNYKHCLFQLKKKQRKCFLIAGKSHSLKPSCLTISTSMNWIAIEEALS